MTTSFSSQTVTLNHSLFNNLWKASKAYNAERVYHNNARLLFPMKFWNMISFCCVSKTFYAKMSVFIKKVSNCISKLVRFQNSLGKKAVWRKKAIIVQKTSPKQPQIPWKPFFKKKFTNAAQVSFQLSLRFEEVALEVNCTNFTNELSKKMSEPMFTTQYLQKQTL